MIYHKTMNSKGIAGILILCLIFVAIIVVGGMFYHTHPAIAPTMPRDIGNPTNQSTTTGGSMTSTTTPTPVSPPAPISKPPAATSSLNPQNGPVGTMVTVHGNGFGVSNTVEMNGLVAASLKNVASPDGTTLRFTVPSTLEPNCDPGRMCAQFLLEVTPNAYAVSVITNGTTQKIGTFTVTAK
jgi:hypothetical protein